MSVEMKSMEATLQQWGASLDDLLAKANEAGADVKAEYLKNIKELKSKHTVVKAKLTQLEKARGAEWDAFKSGIEGTWNELEGAFKKLTTELGKAGS